MTPVKTAIIVAVIAGICASVVTVWMLPGQPQAAISASSAAGAAAAAVVVLRCRRRRDDAARVSGNR